MLGKIRALLSKAEATTFSEEADAFTEKAQDLMTRYAIDEALLDDADGHREVDTIRIHVENPYAQAKAQLLSTVGAVNRVRVIWDDHHGMATAVGMAIDLQLVEMLFTSLLVQATLSIAAAIIAEAALSFLGLGQQPPAPSWGSMLNSAQRFLTTASWMAIWPGLAIFLTVLSFNLVGDGLRDALDPKER
jgi:hypothetical protein